MNIKEAVKKYDARNYLRFLEEFPDQLKDACDLDVPNLSKRSTDIHTFVVAGMGGSAIGGEMVQSLFGNEIPVPVHIVRDYNLPAFINSYSLVIISSYSGNTEETLSAYHQALQTGATILCISTGGALAQLAEKHGNPIVVLPEGYQPRAAICYSLIPILKILQNVGLLSDKMREIDETVNSLAELGTRYSIELSEDSDPYKLALQLFGKVPIIYSGYAPLYALGTRWKCQLNENAKVPAYNQNIPELNHNEIMGWNKKFRGSDTFSVIFLRDSGEPLPITRRIEITQEIIHSQKGKYTDVWSTGSSILTRAFSLLYYGDYTSYYLALLNQKDPSQIDNINYLKNGLQKL